MKNIKNNVLLQILTLLSGLFLTPSLWAQTQAVVTHPHTRDCMRPMTKEDLYKPEDAGFVPCDSIELSRDPAKLLRSGADQRLFFNVELAQSFSDSSQTKSDIIYDQVAFDLSNDDLSEGKIFGFKSTSSDAHPPIIFDIGIKVGVAPWLVQNLVKDRTQKIINQDVGQAYDEAHKIVQLQVRQVLGQIPLFGTLPPLIQNPIQGSLSNVVYNTIAAQIIAQQKAFYEARVQRRLSPFLNDQTFKDFHVGIAFRFLDNNTIGIKLGRFAVQGGASTNSANQTQWEAAKVLPDRVQNALNTSPAIALQASLKHEFSQNAALTGQVTGFNNSPQEASAFGYGVNYFSMPDQDYENHQKLDRMDSHLERLILNTQYLEVHASHGNFDQHEAQGAGLNLNVTSHDALTFDAVQTDRKFNNPDPYITPDYDISSGGTLGAQHTQKIFGKPLDMTLGYQRYRNSFEAEKSFMPFTKVNQASAGLKYAVIQGKWRGMPVQMQVAGEYVRRNDTRAYDGVYEKDKYNDWNAGLSWKVDFKN